MKLFLIGLLSVVIWNCRAQVFYEQFYNESGIRAGNHINQSSDGGYIISGFSNPSNTTFGLRSGLIKIDSLGSVEWSNFYDFGFSSEARSVVEASDGGFVFTGQQANPLTNSDDVMIYKVDNVGNIVWTKLFGDTLSEIGFDIKENPSDSGLIIAGVSGLNPILIRCDKFGDTLWTKKYIDTAGFLGLDITSDESVVLSGMIITAGDNRGYVRKVSSQGIPIWVTQFTAGFQESLEDAIVFNGDSIALVGTSTLYSFPKFDGIIRVLDSAGNESWHEVYPGFGTGQNDVFYGVTLTGDGFVAAGQSIKSVANSENAICVSRYDKSGNLVWDKFFGDFVGSQYGYDVCASHDGGFVACGQRVDVNGSVLYVIKMDENGNTLSVIKIPDPLDISIYPNPMNDITKISFGEPLTSDATLEIYSSNGQLVRKYVIKAGQIEHVFHKEQLNSGLYLVNLKSKQLIISKKLIVD